MKFNYKLVLLTFSISISLSLWFSNCSPQWQAGDDSLINISSQCGENKTVNKLELEELIHKAHSPIKGAKVKCPGFFANIDADIPDNSKSHLSKLEALNNDCNINGPINDKDIDPTSTSEDTLIKLLITKTNPTNIANSVTTLSNGDTWQTRFHASIENNEAPDWIFNEFTQLAGNRNDIEINKVMHQNTTQNSIEVIIKGQTDKYVILGGHHDSIVSRNTPDARSPGADDNASGVSVLIETFRVLIQENYKPEHNIVFYTYAAEEVGLVGSQEIARSYSNDGKDVIGVLQLDMAMFSTTNPNSLFFVTDYTSPILTSFAKDLVIKYLGMEVEFMECGYACSDHASWNNYNYPAILPAEYNVEQSIQRIHTINDVFNNQMDPSYAEKFAKFAISFAVSLAKISP